MTHIEKMKHGLEVLEEAVHYTSAPVWSPSMTKECNEAIASLRQAIAEAEKQEPVAFAAHGVVNWIADKQFMHEAELYTRPPQREWVGLTDEEINAIDGCMFPMSWARKIDAKLKQKNGY